MLTIDAMLQALIALTADLNVAGEWCLVLTNAEKYLRAEIVDPACASGVLVKLVDVGVCEEVTPDKVKTLAALDVPKPGTLILVGRSWYFL